MFMVQLLVKFKFFIQELWERKSLQILTTGVSCTLGAAVYCLFLSTTQVCLILIIMVPLQNYVP
jgi:hypothetical protein